MAELKDSEIFTSDNRAEESAHLQARELEKKPAKELNRDEVAKEYSRMVTTLPEYIREKTKEMDDMRKRGIPDMSAYVKARKDMQKAYVRFADVSQRTVDFAEEIEDAYTASLKAYVEGEHEVNDKKNEEALKQREESMLPPELYLEGEHKVNDKKFEEVRSQQEAAKLPLELYDEEVRKLLYVAAELETNVGSFAKQGMLDKLRPTIKEEMQGILDKLEELDMQSPDVKGQSREREQLIDILIQISDLLEKPEAVAVASPLSESRMAYRTVKAEYASVQHMLSEEQRRAMRMTIANLGETVRQAEDEAWVGMFGNSFARAPQEQFEPVPPPEPPTPDIRGAIARATEHAPALTTAVFASLPRAIITPQITRPRGIFAAIGDAFKLK